MTARDVAVEDPDWWMPHVLIAIFGGLVAAILRAVPGWSAPLHAWIALDALVVAALATHAGARAARLAARRRWRGAWLALLLAAAMGASAAMLMKYGRSHMTTIDDAMMQAPLAGTGSAR